MTESSPPGSSSFLEDVGKLRTSVHASGILLDRKSNMCEKVEH